MSTLERVFAVAPEASAEAPGRVNMLGEHTDYNEGFVLPAAIARTTRVELAASPEDRHLLYSANEAAGNDARNVVAYRPGERPPRGYARYVHGCVEVLREGGVIVPPVALAIDSSVPIGAGLSSSAALEVAVLRALRAWLDVPMDDVELALAAQRAEVEYVGVRCGIMDQMAASLTDPGHMLFLDTRTLERRLLPFPDATEIVVLDSGVPRALAASGYNERRAECEAAARGLGVKALRDVDSPAKTNTLPPPLDRRARHVVTENARVLAAAAGVDAATFGELMSASHASLRDDFEVSVPALDALAECLTADSAVHGARLTGAGFGGACVALVRAGSAATVKAAALARFASLGFRGEALL